MTEGQQWYVGFLGSTHWKLIREKVYGKFPYCQICDQRYHLQPHHISYEMRGTKNEWKDIRMLCAKHHHEVHFVFWFWRIPRTFPWLYSRYVFVKARYRVVRFILSYIPAAS